MARKEEIFPVYLIAGFLDSGKTTFINGILSDGFALQDRTLLLQFEEGEVEYDSKLLRNVTVLKAEDPGQLTAEFLEDQRKACRAVQIIVEFNGMWQIQDFCVNTMPKSWVLYQIITTAQAPTFDLYTKNMGSLMLEKLKNADMIVINRCDESLRAALRQKNLRLVNRQADIYLENTDGSSENYMDGTVSAFDLKQEVLRISDEDYGLWYVEIMDAPQMYAGKTVVFRGIMCRPPQYGDYFTPGRFAMVCCAEDMNFLALPCIGFDTSAIPEKTWVEVTGQVQVEHFDPYGGDGPVLHVSAVSPCAKPKEDIVQM